MADRGTIGTNCFSCQARGKTEWCVLDDPQLDVINSHKRAKVYQPGEEIFFEGDAAAGVYCIESGMVGVRKSDAEGNSILLSILSEGDTLGYRALLADEPLGASAEVLETSRVCFIDKKTVFNLLDCTPALGLRFLRRAAQDLGRADERLLENISLSVRERFAHMLVILIRRYGDWRDDDSASIELPMSRQDLASMIGTTPESLSRTIRAIENDGIACFDKRNVRVPDCRKLVGEFETGIAL